MKKLERKNGITLVALVITVIVLLILAGITISALSDENGLLDKAKSGGNEHQKQAATEKINLKITNIQIKGYAENDQLPDLQYVANELCKDGDMAYVRVKDKKTSAKDDEFILPSVTVGENDSIITKLKEYPYEFEINSELQLASIDGTKVASNNNSNIIMLTSVISDISGGTFKINVNDVEAHNAGQLYYYVNGTLVYQGTDTSYTVTEINGQPIQDNTEYKVKVLSDAYELKVVTNEGDNVSSWLSCIGNPNNEGYTLDNLDDLYANNTLMEDLLNSEIANGYLVKSSQRILPYMLGKVGEDTKIQNALKSMAKSIPKLTSNSSNDFTLTGNQCGRI